MRGAVTVLLREEYGYRYWRWMPDMSADECQAWWKGMRSVAPYFGNPVGLPGSVEQVSSEEGWALLESEGAWEAHLHLDDNSWLAPPDGELITHAGYEPA